MDEGGFCNDVFLMCYDKYFSDPFKRSKTVIICTLCTWITGVLGNLVNVAVFSHKNMTHPINSIFLWLSVSDLLELAILAPYQWFCRWCGMIEIITDKSIVSREFGCMLILIYRYLFLVIHTITIGLNIVLVFCQYMVVAHPFIKQKNKFNNRFIKLAIILIYFSSFFLYLPIFYVYEIMKYDNADCAIELRIIYKLYYTSSIDTTLLHTSVLVCGVILRIGPLIILMILCAMLLFAMQSAHRKRKDSGMNARQLSKAQRKMNRMNVTTVIVITMFLITEVPFGISALLMFRIDTYLCTYAIDYIILLPVILLNCSYSTFCYLIRIKEYRKTLKLLLNKSNWISSRARVVGQPDLELHPL